MYKTFNDLEFYTHHTGFGKQARWTSLTATESP